MGATSRRLVLAARPDGRPLADVVALDEQPLRDVGPGEVAVRVTWLVIDPATRAFFNETPLYGASTPIGGVISSFGRGVVEASLAPGFAVGDVVQGRFGWRDRAVVAVQTSSPVAGAASSVEHVQPDVDDVTSLLLLGSTGMTAYVGMVDVARVQAAERVVVTGASGGVGSLAAQLGSARGCTVVAVTGDAERAGWLRQHASSLVVVDRSAGPLDAQLAAVLPDGFDVCFDNVGGAVLDTCIAQGAPRARIVLCGGIASGYGDPRAASGIHNYVLMTSRRMRMEGFVVGDHAERYGEAAEALLALRRAGDLAIRYEVHEGLEAAPHALQRVMDGTARGKQLVRL